MVSVTSASRYITSVSRYHPRYQSRSSIYIRGLISRNFAELAEAVPIEMSSVTDTGSVSRDKGRQKDVKASDSNIKDQTEKVYKKVLAKYFRL